MAVEVSGREPVPSEEELEGGDVPAPPPEDEHARPEAMAAEAAESALRLRAGDAVDGEAGSTLEAPDGRGRLRAADAVDRSEVEPLRVQGDLERRHARPAGTDGRPREHESGQKGGEKRYGHSERHNPGLGSRIGGRGIPL
jgi:hypothetical protein